MSNFYRVGLVRRLRLIIVLLLVTVPFFFYAVLLRQRTKLPLALSLALAEKGLAWAGFPSATNTRAVQELMVSDSVAETNYYRLYAAWDKAWYQGVKPTITRRCQAFTWAVILLLWGFIRGFTRTKVASKKG